MLVTGGAGFVGSAVCRHLINTGRYRVINADKLTYCGNLGSLRSIVDSPSYRFEQADIADGGAMRALMLDESVDAVIHLAAETHVDRSIAQADPFIGTNVVGTSRLLDATLAYWRALPPGRREAFRFHHVSTDEVFGDAGEHGPPFTETSPYAPSSPYAASKAGSDHLVRAWHRTYGLPVVISNSSNNYGPFQYPEKLVPLMILAAIEGRTLPVYGDGGNVRDWLHVDDHAHGLELVLRHGAVAETYLIGGSAERRNIEVVERLCDLIDERQPLAGGRRRRELIAFVVDRPGHDRRYAVDPSKVERALGWRPKRSFEEGLAQTVDWYLANEDWWRRLLAGQTR